MAKKVKNADGTTNWFGDKQSLNWIQRTINNIGNGFSSALAKYTGSELTAADREANAFNAAEAEKARQHDIFMAENKYAMETQSMVDAGINPALVYGGGNLVSTHATGAAASSVNPDSSSNLGDLAQMFMSIARLPQELKNLKKQNDLLESEADKNAAEAKLAEQNAELAGTTINLNEIRIEIEEQTKQDNIEAARLRNDLTRAERKKIEAQLDEIDANISLRIKEAATEEERKYLVMAQTALARANADEVATLMPFRQSLLQAQTAEAQAGALLAEVNKMKELKLINEGYYDSIIDEAFSKAEQSQMQSELLAIKEALRTGTYFTIDENDTKMKQAFDKFRNKLFMAITTFNDNMNPIAGSNFGYIGGAQTNSQSQSTQQGTKVVENIK